MAWRGCALTARVALTSVRCGIGLVGSAMKQKDGLDELLDSHLVLLAVALWFMMLESPSEIISTTLVPISVILFMGYMSTHG